MLHVVNKCMHNRALLLERKLRILNPLKLWLSLIVHPSMRKASSHQSLSRLALNQKKDPLAKKIL